MDIALMSGAYVNAGDFLIEQRSQKLLEHLLNEAHVEILKRNILYDNRIGELNQYDLIVFGGGPGYQKKLYPDRMPFVSDFNQLKTPVSIMGWGWKGSVNVEKDIYKQAFKKCMLDFLYFVDQQGIPLGCRDWYTLRFLKNQGFTNTIMTGCPAWYNIEKVDDLQFRTVGLEKEDLNICVSDAAFAYNKVLMEPLVSFLRIKYPKAHISLIFHRGITKEDKGILNKTFLEKYNLKYEDISGSADGFSIYDTCDIHIGFRVHAHIYNLSQGNVSILINEDARGFGVNDALGIQNIELKGRIKSHKKSAAILVKAIDDYLEYINETDFLQYKRACMNIQFYYKKMKEYIQKLESIHE